MASCFSAGHPLSSVLQIVRRPAADPEEERVHSPRGNTPSKHLVSTGIARHQRSAGICGRAAGDEVIESIPVYLRIVDENTLRL